MMTKRVRQQIYKKCLVVLICLLIVGNSAHGVVLCLGGDGHIEIESAFHGRCEDSARSECSDQNQVAYQLGHANERHCEPCVDIPISISIAKMTGMSQKLNSTFSAPVTNEIVHANTFNPSAYNSASNTFDAASYFTPLRTVILVV